MAKFASAEAKVAICFFMVCMVLPSVAAAGYSSVAVETGAVMTACDDLTMCEDSTDDLHAGSWPRPELFQKYTKIFYIISLAVDIYGN